MPHQFRLSMEELKENITRMSLLVNEQVQLAVDSLTKDSNLIYKKIKLRDDEIDAYDELLQVQCENIFALHQPIAFDLRYVISTLKINNQLERCGDISVSIANRARKVDTRKDMILESGVVSMAEEAQKMLAEAIEAFQQANSQLAQKVIINDVKVDKLNSSAFSFVTKKMQSIPAYIEPLAHILILSRQIERLADHATNIAENVLFLVDAKVASHRQINNNVTNINYTK